MSSWYPCYSPDGEHLASGDGPWILNGGVQPGRGYHPWWADSVRLLRYDDSQNAVVQLDMRDGTETILASPAPCNNDGFATAGAWGGGGRWLWWTASNGRQVHLDDGSIIQGALSPVINSSHLAYLLDGDAPAQRVIVDGRLVATMPAFAMKGSAEGLCWRSSDGLWTMRWTDAMPVTQKPSWEALALGIPMDGPDGLYLLAMDNHRLMLVKWGTSTGWVIFEGDTRYPHAAFHVPTATWRVAWTNSQGVPGQMFVSQSTPMVDVCHDEHEPPPPKPPEIREVTFAPKIGTAPLTVIGAADWVGINLRWQAWREGDDRFRNDQSAVNDSPHTYKPDFEAGRHKVRILVQGEDRQVITSLPEEIVVVTPPPPPDPEYMKGFEGFVFTRQRSTLELAYGYGWRMCRMDEPEWNIAEVKSVGLRVLKIIRSPSQIGLVPDWTDVDCYNEPDISGTHWPHLTPAQYADLVREIVRAIGDRPIRTWLNVGDTSDDGLRYLEQVALLLRDVPWYGLAPHRYPVLPNITAPKKGHPNRAAEFVRLRAFGKPWGFGEDGLDRQKTWREGACWNARTVSLTQTDCVRLQAQEEQIVRDAGGEFVCWFALPADPRWGLTINDQEFTLQGRRGRA